MSLIRDIFVVGAVLIIGLFIYIRIRFPFGGS
jgi:hypothetical protein